MEELVNHDDLRGRAILLKSLPELRSADANEPRATLGEGQRRAGAALRRRAVIEKSQDTEGLSWTLSARRERGREALAVFIGKVGEKLLAAGAGETGGSALDRAPHSQSNVAVHVSEQHRCLRAGATYDPNQESAGKNSAAPHDLLLSGGPYGGGRMASTGSRENAAKRPSCP